MAGDEFINESHRSEEPAPAEISHSPATRLNRKLVAVMAIVALVAVLAVGWILIRSSRQAQPTSVTTTKAAPPTVMITTVVSQTVNKESRLPGELRAYQNVAIYPKVQGFV